MKLSIPRSVYFSVLLLSLAIASWHSLSRPTQTVLRYWLADLQNFTAAPANLLLGSSSLARLDTVLLEDCGSWHNRAIGNSQLSDIRRYLNWTPRRQQPAHLVLYGGENDLARQQTPQQVSTAYIALLQQLQTSYPRAKLHILALKYSPARSQHWPAFTEVNAKLHAYAKLQPQVHFYNHRLQPQHFTADGIHLTADGYRLFLQGVTTLCKAAANG